mgnify:CR=1 FL=1
MQVEKVDSTPVIPIKRPQTAVVKKSKAQDLEPIEEPKVIEPPKPIYMPPGLASST